jgi:hypothetical protein
LESEAAGQFERAMKKHPQNAGYQAEIGQNQRAEPLAMDAAKTNLSL